MCVVTITDNSAYRYVKGLHHYKMTILRKMAILNLKKFVISLFLHDLPNFRQVTRIVEDQIGLGK